MQGHEHVSSCGGLEAFARRVEHAEQEHPDRAQLHIFVICVKGGSVDLGSGIPEKPLTISVHDKRGDLREEGRSGEHVAGAELQNDVLLVVQELLKCDSGCGMRQSLLLV